MAKKKSKSIVPIVLCIIVLLGSVISLPVLNNIFWKSSGVQTEKKEEKKKEIPNKYQCSYGPNVDSFYNYIKYEYIVFNFDKNGNLSSIDSEVKYQVTSIDEYNKMLQVLNLPKEKTTYDENNYIVTVRNKENTIFPENYKELKKYLSTNQYICVEE